MGYENPNVILIDGYGNSLPIQNGVAIPGSTPAILLAGSDGTNSRYLTLDSSGRTVLVGAGTAGTPAGGVITIQGASGGQAIPVSGTITATINSSSATGSATPSSASLAGGAVTTATPTYTNGNLGALSLTTSGLLRVDASSATITINGNATDNTTNVTTKLPVMAAVAATAAPTWTSGNMVPLSVDTSGSLRVTGTITANNSSVSTTGTAPPGSATYISGSVTTAAPTYTTGQMNALSLTTAGSLRVDGSGSTQPVSGTITSNQGIANTLANRWPVIITDGTNTMPVGDVAARGIFNKITDGTNTVTVKAASTEAVAADPALVIAVSPNNTSFIRDREFATFTALATGIALGNNKSMFSIQNTTGSAVKCKIHEIYMINVQTTGVTGVITTFELRRATSHAAGTAITAIETMETTDSLNASITVRTNATITSESTTLLWRNLWSSDEWGARALDTESNDHSIQTMFPVYSRKTQGLKPITLNANETLTIKCATNTTAGTFDLLVVFTQE